MEEQAVAQPAKSYEAPNGTEAKVLTFNGTVGATIAVRVPGKRGEEPYFDLVAAPKGSHALYSAPRQCGDWYAEFTAGKRMASAVHRTQIGAVQLAAAAMEAA